MTDPTAGLATKAILPQQLDEIMARHAAAEAGWHMKRDPENPYHVVIEGDGPTVIAHLGATDNGDESYPVEENAEFAVHAYQDIPALVGEVRRLQAALELGADSNDPLAILRQGVEQARLNAERSTQRIAELEKTWQAIQGDFDYMQRVQMPELRREVDFQKGGKVRWRDRAVAAEQKVELVGAEVASLTARVAELQADSDLLRSLEAAGVDNWEGYDEAVSSRG